MKKKITHLFLFALTTLFIQSVQSAETKEFALITMMKTGTHMTKDLLTKLTDQKPKFISRDSYLNLKNNKKSDLLNPSFSPSFFTLLSSFKKSNCFAFSHSVLANPYSVYASNNNDFVLVTNHRDLRDAVISYVYYLDKRDEYKRDFPNKKLTLDQKIMYCIERYTNQVAPLSVINDVENLFIVRFEDLVGAQGGGSDEAQFNLVTELAKKLGVNSSPNKVQRILKDLYGNSGTFRKGVIGEWKTHFNEEHKEAFKKSILGQALIDMGYEKDYEW